MEPIAKPRGARLTSRDLIRICKDKLTCAARDLAEFTQNGINASYIVALAHKCENFEDSLGQPHQAQSHAPSSETETEIQQAVQQICEMGRRIWENDPAKYGDYVISTATRTRNLTPKRG
jgi:predicted metalloprotease with PDZ domain